jgi:hypothetical protein
MMRSTSMRLNIYYKDERFVHCPSMRPRPQLTPAALANGHRVPCGHEQNTLTMPRRRLFGSLDAKRCPSSGLTHYGRKTGNPHEVTIWFVPDGDSNAQHNSSPTVANTNAP